MNVVGTEFSTPPPLPSLSPFPLSPPDHPDASQSVCWQLHCKPARRVGRVRGAGLIPGGRALLLPLPAGEHQPHHNGPGACCVLHCVHAGLMCLLLQDMDRCLRVFCQGCELCTCACGGRGWCGMCPKMHACVCAHVSWSDY